MRIRALVADEDQPGVLQYDWSPIPQMGPEKHLGYAVQWFGLAVALTLIYFGFFFLMPAYTRETSDKTTMTKLYFIAMAIATLATLYYWWVFDGGADGTMLVKLIVTVIAAGHFLIFGIKPWLKPEQSKPVPERVTG